MSTVRHRIEERIGHVSSTHKIPAHVIAAVLIMALSVQVAHAQTTGRVDGSVLDARTGETLPGVNVVVDGTDRGAVTDGQGRYTIVGVPAGTHSVRATFVGYQTHLMEGVRVNIGLNTAVDFYLEEEVIGLEQVVVTAERPVVQRDVAANVANLSMSDFENVPVASIEGVVGLQAGIEPGLQVRGSGVDQMQFMVDGMSMRLGRDNVPFSGVSYTAVAEVQVQTGGFSAEYGNVRSGLVNVVTRQGPRDRYTVDAIIRYSGAAQKHFGIPPNHPDAYYMRPFLDPAVAFVGTRGAASPWDHYMERQYPEFAGWNAVARGFPGMTEEQLQQVFLYHHRKNVTPSDADYEIDASVGGPIAGVGASLGSLRFFGSYRQTQNAYMIPQSRDVYRDRMGQIKFTSDVAPGMQLNVQGLYAKQFGVNADNNLGTSSIFKGEMPKYPWDTRGDVLATHLGGAGRQGSSYGAVFSNIVWNPMDVRHVVVSADLTHSIGRNTFYEVRLQRFQTDYSTNPGVARSMTPVTTIGTMELDDAPFGWSNLNEFGVTGERLAGHWGRARDSSQVATWTGKFDIQSQLNRHNLLRAGVDVIYNDLNINHGIVDEWFFHHANPYYVWRRNPVQGAIYAQNRFDFQHMVANIGLRLDYFDAATEWYVYDVYSDALSALHGFRRIDEVADSEQVESQLALSPRLGVSFPVTLNSKLYFNYGHFRQMLHPTNLFEVRGINSGAIDRIGNPDHPMPLTVAYELGYEQNVLDLFLLRLTGYYKDLSKQPRHVRYVNIDGMVNYQTSLPHNYSDVRGFEFTIQKDRGWLRGFVNYTYMVVKRGNFGVSTYYENMVEQAEFLRQTRGHYQDRAVPEPFARFNLDLKAPAGFGPRILGQHLLEDWRLNFLGEWRSGQIFTWHGGDPIPGLENNVQYRDYYNLDLRVSRNITTSLGQAQFFVDVTNALNLRHLYRGSAFAGSENFEYYMRSLHLPEDTFAEAAEVPYAFIPGNDRPGDYRKPGVDFVPIEIVSELPNQGHAGPTTVLYYLQGSREYMQWLNGSWQPADHQFVKDVIDNKAYIEMPAHHRSFGFLNPRRLMFGMRVSI